MTILDNGQCDKRNREPVVWLLDDYRLAVSNTLTSIDSRTITFLPKIKKKGKRRYPIYLMFWVN